MVFFSKTQSKLDIVNNVLLPAWKNYCERHWLDERPGKLFSPEQRVKGFLDGLAYLLLRDDPGDTLTTYKMIVRGSTEIDVSSCPAEIEDVLYGNGATLRESNDIAAFEMLVEKLDSLAEPYKKPKKDKPKLGHPNRYEKIERLKRDFPDSSIHILPVDTENIFEFDRQEYQIDESVRQYQPQHTREGVLFDMDRIVVVQTAENELIFLDQVFEPIHSSLIHALGETGAAAFNVKTYAVSED